MPSYTRFRSAVVAKDGFYVGSKGSETVVIGSTGAIASTMLVNSGIKSPLVVSFASASTAQAVYTISPYAGTISAVYVCSETATQAAAYSCTHGSAGDVFASATATSGSAGTVSSMTLGTVTVTAGESLACARAACGTTGVSTVTIVITRTA